VTANFHLAPPAKTVDGVLAVPIDIQSIDAKFTFDGAAQTGSGDVTIQYTVGPTAGNPFFDLRQTIAAAWLDGAAVPVAQIASHDFGEGAIAGLRILEASQPAGSVHALRVQYAIAAPASQAGGSYPPVIAWSAGPRLRLTLGMTDLFAARYLEAWIPANLIFDQYSIQLEVDIQNTTIPHSIVTNGQVTIIGSDHWSVAFPARFSALSPLLEIRATDALETASGTVTLPVSGTVVTIDAWKPAGGGAVLATEINNLKTHLTDNENGYGGYLHGSRFVAFLNVGGMEYEGGTTTASASLRHETFHSWFARGVKPASQADGWWDEAFTVFHDNGANDALPFSFTDPPIVLCSRNPWQRTTPNNSYTDGFRFWEGVAAEVGVATLNNLMRDFYEQYKGNPVSTPMLEEFLVARAGVPELVDAFHRFVYGFADPAPTPELWMKDAPADPGADLWAGTFWNSPDLWIRNLDDDVTTHQSPEYGQDNWFYARVRNKATAGVCRHYVVTFQVKEYLGTEFVYPQDFLPCVVATADFDLAPGGTRIVKARWPRAEVPSAGTHACVLASVISRLDAAPSGRHAWEHNNLAQKNVTVVDLAPDSFVIVPILLRTLREPITRYALEIWRDPVVSNYPVAVLNLSREGDRTSREPVARTELLDCGGLAGREGSRPTPVMTSKTAALIAERFRNAIEVELPQERVSRLPVQLRRATPQSVGVRVGVPRNARPGTVIRTHVAQRLEETNALTGGVMIEIHVTK